jgi:hypothetical protein
MADAAISDELESLGAKRKALQEGLHIAVLIEGLNRSLGAILIANQPGRSLPAEAVSYYERLDDRSRSLPVPLLKVRVAGLSNELQRDFGHILYITRLVGGESNDAGEYAGLDDVEIFLSRFSDHSSLLVGLRVALYKQGENSPALRLNITRERLLRRLEVVSSLERHCRSKLRNEIRALDADVRRLLKGGSVAAAMRAELQGLLEDLRLVQRHVEAGGDIAEIPLLIKTLGWNPTPIDARELADLLKGQEVEEIPVEEIVISAPSHDAEPELGETLKCWLNTPPDVTWEQLRHRKKRGSE